MAFYNKRLVELARMAGAPADKKAGVIIHKKMGERVKKGEPLITICSIFGLGTGERRKRCQEADANRGRGHAPGEISQDHRALELQVLMK